MANTGLRREAEMTLLHPQLGETRRQELRNSLYSMANTGLRREAEMTPYLHSWGKRDVKNLGTRIFGTRPCSSLKL